MFAKKLLKFSLFHDCFLTDMILEGEIKTLLNGGATFELVSVGDILSVPSSLYLNK